MANNGHNYYSNPAFCQQSEFYNYPRQPRRSPQKGLSPQRNQNCLRQSPVGAQSPIRVVDTAFHNVQENLPPKPGPKPPKITGENKNYQEQDFYEEMLVDDTGFVKQKKIVIVSANNDSRNGNAPRYACVPQNDNQGNRGRYVEHAKIYEQENDNRYAVAPLVEDAAPRDPSKYQKHRYEYIPMQRQDANYNQSPAKEQYLEEEFEMENRMIHRYSVIPTEEETELTTKGRYEVCPVSPKRDYRYSSMQQHPKVNLNRRYEYIDSIQETENYEQARYNRPNENQQLPRKVVSPVPPRRPGNPYATQKLHELLTTPKKTHISYTNSPQKITSPQSPRKVTSPSTIDPFVTPNKTQRKITRERTPKAQQKLNYALSTRQVSQDKRHTAIVAPICSSPVQSVYSETTFSNKSESWMNLSGNKQPVHATLTVAATMMILCGGLTSCLCFYMLSFMGRLYFLDFGIISGIACLILGFLGCRSRNYYYWLPNRNYMSGYIILTLFSLLTCVGLLVLLFTQPKPGSPLADMTSGAVCGISVLSLILASAGVMASYCCKMPPPDNRVEHCARGFTV